MTDLNSENANVQVDEEPDRCPRCGMPTPPYFYEDLDPRAEMQLYPPEEA